MGKKIIVPDMHCEKCVARITNCLDGINIKANIDLQAKTVEIADETQFQRAFDEIYELGFSPKGSDE